MSVRCQTYALHLTLTASRLPTRSGNLFNCEHPDYRPVYAEPAVRLARIRTLSRLLPAVRTKLHEAAVHDRQLGFNLRPLRRSR